MNTAPSAPRPPRHSPAPAARAVLTVRGLAKTYGGDTTAVQAVNGIDLEVRSGELLLIMGPSGSGKTTVLLMLGALLRPRPGRSW